MAKDKTPSKKEAKKAFKKAAAKAESFAQDAEKAEKKALKAARKANKVAAKAGLDLVLEDTAAAPEKTSGSAVSPLKPGKALQLPDVAGVRFAAASAGVKYRDRTDVMLVELAPGTALAGVYTQSGTASAAVLDSRSKLGGSTRNSAAIVVNSGNSNAFTGAAGAQAVDEIVAAVAETLNTPKARIHTASTGVIGELLPADKIIAVLPALKETLSGSAMRDAASAIMTTDTFAKGATARATLSDGSEITVAGIAKGSGMIAPDMATMLAYVFTDAAIEQSALQSMLGTLTARTFNAISVDGDTSTSDTLMLAATGKAGNAPVTSGRTADGRALAAALETVMGDLARQIVRDGEGARKFIEVRVTGARNAADARKVASAIANSPLVKTACAGEDPNWGRVVMAIGKSGAKADRDALTIHFGDILVAEKGQVAESYSEDAGATYMKRAELEIVVDLGIGSGAATMWTCDLTHGYIDINADYRS